ncbi:MAG: SlyX family protein [Thiotrichales bacterium]
MSNEHEHESRIIELECRIALQEDLLQALQSQMLEQERVILELRRHVSLQRDWLAALQPSPLAPRSEEQPPPHY